MSTILLVGEDESLQQTRAAVLRTIGADVFCSDSISALNVQADRECDLVVLCHTLPEPLSTQIAEIIHSRWPRTRILQLIVSNDWQTAEAAPAVDAISSADPERLVRRAVELLGRRPPGRLRPPDAPSGRMLA